MNFKQKLLHHWQAKLGSFLAACVLWIVLKEAFEPGTLDQILTGTRVKSNPTQQK
ncbi:MAG: hypothetical protein V4507_13425 [Verrucomicrobiota bacterium]